MESAFSFLANAYVALAASTKNQGDKMTDTDGSHADTVTCTWCTRCFGESSALCRAWSVTSRPVNTRAGEEVDAWRANPTAEGGEAVSDVLGQLIRELDEHMRLEEQQILPLAEKCITAAEWHAMA